MSKRIILLGDQTDHGGVVQDGDPLRQYAGRPIARLGDPVSCPYHGSTTIAEGEPSYTIDGIPVALEGHKTACGAVLIGSVGGKVG